MNTGKNADKEKSGTVEQQKGLPVGEARACPVKCEVVSLFHQGLPGEMRSMSVFHQSLPGEMRSHERISSEPAR